MFAHEPCIVADMIEMEYFSACRRDHIFNCCVFRKEVQLLSHFKTKLCAVPVLLINRFFVVQTLKSHILMVIAECLPHISTELLTSHAQYPSSDGDKSLFESIDHLKEVRVKNVEYL